MSEFIEKINSLRGGLNIAKNSYNKFGNFKYRSLPDIFSGIQNNLKLAGLYVEITDELIFEPLCIKSKAILSDGKNKIESTAHAMIGTKTNKDGKAQMDLSQQTGSATSYARKYALEALFLLADDNCSDSLSGESSSVQKAVQNTPSSPPPAPKPPTETFKIEKTAEMPNQGLSCPKCKIGTIVESDKAIGCDKWRDGCKFSALKRGSNMNMKYMDDLLQGKEPSALKMVKNGGGFYYGSYSISDEILPEFKFRTEACFELGG